MKSTNWYLRVALFLPFVLVLLLSVRGWRSEGSSLELEFERAARARALDLAVTVERIAEGAPVQGQRLAGPGALEIPDRSSRGPQPESAVAAWSRTAGRLSRDEGAEACRDWLATQLERTTNPAETLWLQLRLASELDRLLDGAGARELLEKAAAATEEGEASLARDDRGVRLDLICRALLVFRDEADEVGSSADRMRRAAGVASALAEDQIYPDEWGAVVLRERLESLAEQSFADDARWSWNELRASGLDSGPAPALGWSTDSRGERWLVTAAQTADGLAVRGLDAETLHARLFSDTVLAALSELRATASVHGPDGAIVLRSGEVLLTSDAFPVANVALPAGLGDVRIYEEVQGAAQELVGARRRGWLLSTGALALGALVVALLGLRSLRRKEDLQRDREGFVAAVSHELKTPLTATRLLGELLERGDLDESKVREFGGRIARESERLAQLVKGVLDLSRLERIGLEEGRAETVRPAELLQEAARRCELILESSGMRAVTAGNDVALVTVDTEAILGALVNLIENVVKHAPATDTVELSVVTAGAGRVRLEVSDRGPGVPDADLTRIFGEFQRGGSEDTRTTTGAGIGLALVGRIADAHGGLAMARNRTGGGAVFVIELPRASGVPSEGEVA